MEHSIRRGISLAVAFLIAGCSHGGGGSSTSASTVAPATSASLPAPVTSGSTSPATTVAPPPPAKPAYPIDHVFIIFKENHTFDNYFGTYPGANGVMTAKTSTGATVPLAPWITEIDYPGHNGWSRAHEAYDNGLMDKFDLVGGSPPFPGLNFIVSGPFHSYAPANGQPGGPIKYYWQIAQQGVLCDNYFTSVMGCSSPNHIFSMAAQCYGLISNEDPLTHQWQIIDANGNEVSHPNHFSPQEIPTALPNELEKKGLTWKYLAESEGAGILGQIMTMVEDNDASIKGLDVVAQLPSFARCYDDTTESLDTNLAGLLASGDVGNVTWIKPAPFVCEHPGIGPVGYGADWTRKVVNEIGNSSYWDHCVILITFDDYGGFYDHVAPPQVDGMGLGFRVPCMIVSPYAKRGFVDHTQLEHSSLCKLAETLFGLPSMTKRDAASADMLEAFDFSQPPRPFSDFRF